MDTGLLTTDFLRQPEEKRKDKFLEIQSKHSDVKGKLLLVI